MTETVLQSFCERCGKRYTVTEQAPRREGGLSRLGRSLGLRATKEPPAEAQVSTALPTHDPFRGTFSFCLECRQYTCSDCWNPEAGYCQSCVPLPGAEPLAADAPPPASPLPSLPPSPPSAAVPRLATQPRTAMDPGPGAAIRPRTPAVEPADRAGSPSATTARETPTPAIPTSSWPTADRPPERDTSAAASAGTSVSPAGDQDATPRARATEPTTAGLTTDERGVPGDPWHTPVPGTPWASGRLPGDTRASTPPSSEPAAPTKAVELDPWRGVVFSAADRGAGMSPDETLADRLEGLPPAPVAEAWPSTDRPERVGHAAADARSGWPDVDRALADTVAQPDAARPEPDLIAAAPSGDPGSRSDGDEAEPDDWMLARQRLAMDVSVDVERLTRVTGGVVGFGHFPPLPQEDAETQVAEHEALPEPAAEVVDAAEVEAPQGISVEPGITVEQEAEVAVEPEPAVETEPAVAAEVEPAPVALAEVVADVEPEIVSEVAVEPEPAVETEPAVAAEVEPEPAVAAAPEQPLPPSMPVPPPPATIPLPLPGPTPTPPTRVAPLPPLPAPSGTPSMPPGPWPGPAQQPSASPVQPFAVAPAGDAPFSQPFQGAPIGQAPFQQDAYGPRPGPVRPPLAPPAAAAPPAPGLGVPPPVLAAQAGPPPRQVPVPAVPGASARPQPAQAAGTRACVKCALPISAKAHFCRRCGASQG